MPGTQGRLRPRLSRAPRGLRRRPGACQRGSGPFACRCEGLGAAGGRDCPGREPPGEDGLCGPARLPVRRRRGRPHGIPRGRRARAAGGLLPALRGGARAGLHDGRPQGPGRAGHFGKLSWRLRLWLRLRPGRRTGRAPHDLHAGGWRAHLLPVPEHLQGRGRASPPAAAAACVDPRGAAALHRSRRDRTLHRHARARPCRAAHERPRRRGAPGAEVPDQFLAALPRVHE
mmetsp:Transcript_20650/g.62227  ORF Transcript_20650/g.62227 Transcript_20650/m.62227 type:complete len:230 (+) Transcript_20650:268-957(+)